MLIPLMNIPRRVAALKREIRYRQDEIVRIAALRGAKEEAGIAFPHFMEKYIADIRTGITSREAEIRELQQDQQS